jgi:predicted RNA binding protein YcfA (HicA-like mRNA interferase family)
MKVRDVIRRLQQDGWYRVKSSSGHRQFRHKTKRGKVTVPGQLGTDVPDGTLKNIWRQAGLPEVK